VISGFIVSLYDFVILQQLNIQLSICGVTGFILLVIGGILRLVSRRTLKKAGFTLFNSGRLQVVEDHQLVTDGVYRLIRHPLYLGEMARNMGFALLLASLFGVIVMMVGNAFLLLRTRIEEAMLIEEFGQKYIEYREKTKHLLLYIF
jgi:protein-S-isoprenylcysteine O-methyltransferase Ste14